MPARAATRRSSKPSSASASRSSWYVWPLAAMPIQSSLRADRDAVEPVDDAVAAGELRAHLVELALHVERVRREQRARSGAGTKSFPSTLHRRHDRHDAVGVDVDGAGAVGDRASTSFSPTHMPLARDSATAWRPRSSASCTSPGKMIGMCRSTSVASLELGSVDDLAAGSSPTTRRRRRGGPCRRTRRGGWRRRPGRARAPCRTRRRRRRRSACRRRSRRAGCPSPRWRRAPR